MQKSMNVREPIEQNGLIIIAVAMALIYGWFDSMVTDQVLVRVLVVCLIFIYGISTQYLINLRKLAEKELQRLLLLLSM
jgi:hypothetical protein